MLKGFVPRRASSRSIATFCVIAAGVVALGTAGTASASEIENGQKAVALNVHGRVSEHCAMGAIGDMRFGDLNRKNLQAAARVQLNCNVPFDMTIQAANGGLANDRYPHGQGPYAGTLPYTMAIAIPVRKPASSLVDRSFTSLELMGGRTISSQGGIALDGMAISVALGDAPGEAGLLAGNYGEKIVITITPS